MHFSIGLRSTSIRYRSLIAALLLSSPVAYADFAIPGFELVHTVPVGTTCKPRTCERLAMSGASCSMGLASVSISNSFMWPISQAR